MLLLLHHIAFVQHDMRFTAVLLSWLQFEAARPLQHLPFVQHLSCTHTSSQLC